MSFGSLLILLFHSVNLKGSIYLNMALGIIIEIPSYLFCIFTVDRFGRRAVLLVSHLICVLCTTAALFVPLNWPGWVVVTLSTIAKFGTTAAFSVVLLQVKMINTFDKSYVLYVLNCCVFRQWNCFQHQ